MEIFGKNIKKELKQQGKKQIELARFLNVQKSTLSEWLNDNNEPPMYIIPQIAVFLDVSTDYLLGLEDDFGNKTYTAPVSDNRHHNVNVYNVTGNHNSIK